MISVFKKPTMSEKKQKQNLKFQIFKYTSDNNILETGIKKQTSLASVGDDVFSALYAAD